MDAAAAVASPVGKRRRKKEKDDTPSRQGEPLDAARDGCAPDAADNERYFCSYAYMYHQMDMLEDEVRTQAYYDAILSNPSCFEGKVVLDVGAGTCILAMMAARAGARQVFAVEATDMALRGRRIVQANGLGDVVTVIQGTMETATIPCQVDVIVSEWMGYLLLRESMLDSVLHARDRYLKPGGCLFPSHANLYLAPVSKVQELAAKKTQWDEEQGHWATFAESMKRSYKFSFACAQEDFMTEQRKYYLQTGNFVHLAPNQLVAPGASVLSIDLLKISISDLQPEDALKCVVPIKSDGPINGFCCYFDTPFRGSPENPASHEVVLSTAPTAGKTTHWGQQAFGFYPPLAAKKGDSLECSLWLGRQKENHRLLTLRGKFALYSSDKGGKRALKREYEDQYYVD